MSLRVMKVLIINKSYFSGGAGIASGRLFKTLCQSGIDVSMMVYDTSSGDDRKLIILTKSFAKKILWWFHFLVERIYFLPFEKNKTFRFAFSPAVSGVDISTHKSVVDADIIHLHWFNQGFLSLDSLKKLIATRKPIVFTLHDMWGFTGGCHYAGDCEQYKEQCGNCFYLKRPNWNDLSYRGLQKKSLIYSNANLTIVTCSNWLGSKARESSLLKDKKILTIPNSIDINFYDQRQKDPIREKLKLPLGKTLVLFGAANLSDARKGLRYFVDSLSFIDLDIELVVFGKNSHLALSHDKYKVYDFGLISSSELMKELYQATDIFILPSLQDNLPNTVMESMACGTPVVAFRVGGVPEMIDHKVNGYLAEYMSAEDLARGIEWVMKNNENNVLGKSAREKVVREYSEEIVAKKHIQLYESLLNEPKH